MERIGIYGGTFNLLSVTMKRMGIEFTFVSPDCSDAELEAAKIWTKYVPLFEFLSNMSSASSASSGDFENLGYALL